METTSCSLNDNDWWADRQNIADHYELVLYVIVPVEMSARKIEINQFIATPNYTVHSTVVMQIMELNLVNNSIIIGS